MPSYTHQVFALLAALVLTSCWGSVGHRAPLTDKDLTTTVLLKQGGSVSRVFTMEGREYSLYSPSNPEQKKLPLVIWFHGAGGVVWPNIQNDYWVKLAQREKFYLLQPQATVGPYTSYSYWNSGFIPNGKDDVLFTQTILDDLLQKEAIDTDRIYATGMSSGGHMAFYVAQHMPETLAAIAPISGLIRYDVLRKYQIKKPMPLCHIHGDADTIVPITGNGELASWQDIREFWLKHNAISMPPTVTKLPDTDQFDTSTVVQTEYRGASIASDIDDYLIVNGNHSIPGIEAPANHNINAYEVIWTFFNKHRLSDAQPEGVCRRGCNVDYFR
jgi:polyhydroxybutyrate depolymerase